MALKVRDKVVCNGQVYLTLGGASRAIGCTTATVRKLADQGQLEPVQLKPNSRHVYTFESISAYMDEQLKEKLAKGKSLKDKPPAHPKKVYYKWKGSLPPNLPPSSSGKS